MSCGLVRVDPCPHFDCERFGKDQGHSSDYVLKRSLASHESRTHPFFVYEIDRTSHINVYKITVNLFFKNLSYTGHLRGTTPTNLNTKEILRLMFLKKSPLWGVTLQQRQGQCHLTASNPM